MKNDKELDKYTAQILKHLDFEETPANFTDKLMDKVLAQQAVHERTEPFSSRKFIFIFVAIFSPIFLLAIIFPSGNLLLPRNIEILNGVFSNLQIDFTHFFTPLIQSLKGSTFLNILPITIVALIAFEQILLKINNFRKA